MRTIFVITFLFVLNIHANELNILIEACEKSNVDFCNQAKEIKKNTEKEAQRIINDYGLSTPFALTGFLIKPEIRIKVKKSHEFKIKLNSQQVSYVFNF